MLPEAVGVPKSIRLGALGARCRTFGGAAKPLLPVVPFCTVTGRMILSAGLAPVQTVKAESVTSLEMDGS